MLHLVATKDNHWALFIGHLVIEKLLKAHFIKAQAKHPILTHDLLRLAKVAGLSVSSQEEEWLDEITTFNINARYDNIKQDFYRRCTPEYTALWIERIEEIRACLIKKL